MVWAGRAEVLVMAGAADSWLRALRFGRDDWGGVEGCWGGGAGFGVVEFGGVAEKKCEDSEEHAGGGQGAAEVEKHDGVAEEVGVGAAEEEEVAGDEQEAEFGGAEGAGGHVEAGERVGSEKAFCCQEQEGEQHGERDDGVAQAGGGQPDHEGGGAEEIGGVVDVEAEAGTLLVARAGEGTVEAVTEPVEGDAEVDEKEQGAVVAAEGIADAGGELGEEAEQGEVVGGNETGGVAGKDGKEAALEGSGEGVVDAGGGGEGQGGVRHGVSFDGCFGAGFRRMALAAGAAL